MLGTAAYANVVSLGNLLTAVALVLLAIPASVIAWKAVRADRHAREVTEVATDVLTMLNGGKPVTPRTPADPSMVDVLAQIERNTRRYVDLADEIDEHTRNPNAHRGG